MPAAFAERMPLWESSTAPHRAGSAPSRRAASRYTSGDGLPRGTSCDETAATKSPARPDARRTTSISSGFEEDAIASGTLAAIRRTARLPRDQRRRVAVPREHALDDRGIDLLRRAGHAAACPPCSATIPASSSPSCRASRCRCRCRPTLARTPRAPRPTPAPSRRSRRRGRRRRLPRSQRVVRRGTRRRASSAHGPSSTDSTSPTKKVWSPVTSVSIVRARQPAGGAGDAASGRRRAPRRRPRGRAAGRRSGRTAARAPPGRLRAPTPPTSPRRAATRGSTPNARPRCRPAAGPARARRATRPCGRAGVLRPRRRRSTRRPASA